MKTHFWDKGRPDIGAYIRRRSLEGEWIWLITTVASYNDQPVPGYILCERRAPDEKHASRMNRITRISAILVQAVEAARLTAPSGDAAPVAEPGSNEIPWVADDAAAYQSWLEQVPGTSGMNVSNNADPLQRIMKVAASGIGNSDPNCPAPTPTESAAKLDQMKMDAEMTGNKEAFDPLAELKALRTGICLDMGMIRLSRAEAKMIALVLTGRLLAEDIAPLVLHAMNSPGQDLGSTLDIYVAETERQNHIQSPQHAMEPSKPLSPPPAITVVNLSYTYMGNSAVEMLSEMLYVDNSPLTTVDVSFCGLEEKGLLAFARGVTERKRKGIPALRGLILSGNYLSYKAAKALGLALSSMIEHRKARKRNKGMLIGKMKAGYEEDTESDDDDEEAVDGDIFAAPGVMQRNSTTSRSEMKDSSSGQSREGGLRLLHVASASLSPESLYQLLYGLGADCPIRELSIQSNRIGSKGATLLVEFLEGKGVPKNQTVMPFLDRLDLSNNDLGNDGTAKLTRAISKRSKIHLVDLRLSSNDIGSGGVETIMNKLLQHNLISLSLDKNAIGDQGCQLVAASLQSMHQLARLNLSFNQIGSRGVNTLMRTLVGCESITYLGLSGNILEDIRCHRAGIHARATSSSRRTRHGQLLLESGCAMPYCCRHHLKSLGSL